MLNELSARIMTWATAARDEEGQGLVEYALILAVVSVASLVALQTLGGGIAPVLDQVSGALTGA